VSFFLRLVGITNAALWFGAALSFTAAVWPAFASGEMLKILPASHAGAAAQVVLARYFFLQYWCGAVAVGHLLLEWLYAGKPLQRWALYLLTAMLALTLFNGLAAQPKLKELHLETYGIRSTPQQREHARKSTGAWAAMLQVSNLLILLGAWVYVWDIQRAETAAKFVTAGKFRG
jgi:hypothetical protein